ncbi:hypothetical protein QFC22_006410 [Naganishia vaughanmartiniae]|uniref:Uncharacterized protein n=1 Tax=Naganishia vaughanmartiniae TaxID=1424756 RepID=A0ACC2WKX0_9TREE|nr:hypothetical protein QFC22_006410 [Naganishia vaughanmartiniae]
MAGGHQMTPATQLVEEGREADSDADEEAAYRGPMKEYTEWALEWAVKNKKKLPLEQISEKDRDAEQ